ncbi:MAG: F0F1 ATP synthase subunit delta [bacterium]|nr:F0F1 ATP synthase subunit delta [bacterium]
MDKAYAQALWRIIEDGANPRGAVKTLCQALGARGRLGLLPKIARAFSLLAARAEAKNVVVLKVARYADGKRALKEARELLKDSTIKTDDVKINIDENLIGGWRLEGRELLHDASYKRQLLDIYERVLEK